MIGFPRQIVFRYNGNPEIDDVELDQFGEVQLPQKGSVVERKGQKWKVVEINIETSVTQPAMIPICRVFLSNQV